MRVVIARTFGYVLVIDTAKQSAAVMNMMDAIKEKNNENDPVLGINFHGNFIMDDFMAVFVSKSLVEDDVEFSTDIYSIFNLGNKKTILPKDKDRICDYVLTRMKNRITFTKVNSLVNAVFSTFQMEHINEYNIEAIKPKDYVIVDRDRCKCDTIKENSL